MINYILGAVIVGILSLSIGYIIKAKKSGVKCIGCPAGSSCSGSCGGCSHHEAEDKAEEHSCHCHRKI